MFGWQHNHVVQGAVQYQQHMQEAKEQQCNINNTQWAAGVPQVIMIQIRVYHLELSVPSQKCASLMKYL